MNGKNLLHIANYAAKYRGNFIESLSILDSNLQSSGVTSFYAFYLPDVDNPQPWMVDLEKAGKKVLYLSGDVFADYKKIRELIKKENISLVHTHFITIKQYLSVALANAFSNFKTIMHFHNHSQKAGKLKSILRNLVYRKCYMIGCSESVYHSIEENFPKNPKSFVDNGIYFQRIDKLDRASRNEYNLKADSTVCLIFGFDFFRKGVDLAVKSIETLNKNGQNIELVISLSTNLEAVKENIIKILGYLPEWAHIIEARNDVYMLYNMADIFLSPSREEGLPYSVIEAAFSRCNVVMSDISAQKYLKVPYGIWHKEGDVSSLEEAILKAIQIGSEKEYNLEQVREEIKNNYSVERWAEQIEMEYKKNEQ
ncbi:MAG: glycosyltransferase family 4 protein [Bacillota bacterium]|nr:glycosyltransferase family 4 protein [Bacillota bacterium]